ncbi:MAG TPA: M48 family metallopeptidase [Candidatus Udaeobacter sp.]|nr:M48 family metallopeptidase [Candidatus Udaeobacter sp.]
MQPFAIVALVLIVARLFTELWLSRINQRHVRAHANQLPPAFREVMDQATYRRSIDYTMAKSRFEEVTCVFDAVMLIAILFSGVLPWAFGKFRASYGDSVWAMTAFLVVVGIALSIPALPFAWYSQFKIEQEFGFNTTRMKTWVFDRVKGLLLALVLGYPLLVLILKLIEWTGANWWIWAAAVVVVFQLLLLVMAPALIMPLFNKFTPLPEGALRERLFALARRTHFPTKSIDVMDGSKRSRHSNAFFTGLGRFRKIVLFDTLITQLTEPELEAVLAHEIGHYKKRHVVKMLGVSIAGMFVAFGAIAWLARQPWFYSAFGFRHQTGFAAANLVPAILLFALLAETITFWISPFIHAWSRRFEYEADAFARAAMGETQSMIQALRKLSEKNLSNLIPHPLYSAFYYSHPTLRERERTLGVPT